MWFPDHSLNLSQQPLNNYNRWLPRSVLKFPDRLDAWKFHTFKKNKINYFVDHVLIFSSQVLSIPGKFCSDCKHALIMCLEIIQRAGLGDMGQNSSGHTQFTQKEIRIVSVPFGCYMKFNYLIIMFLMSDFVIYISVI